MFRAFQQTVNPDTFNVIRYSNKWYCSRGEHGAQPQTQTSETDARLTKRLMYESNEYDVTVIRPDYNNNMTWTCHNTNLRRISRYYMAQIQNMWNSRPRW